MYKKIILVMCIIILSLMPQYSFATEINTDIMWLRLIRLQDEAFNFIGTENLKDDKDGYVKPESDDYLRVMPTAEVKEYDTVDITFNIAIDKISAEVKDNYIIKDIKGNCLDVKEVHLITDKLVRLITGPQISGELYTVTVKEVQSIEGLVIQEGNNITKFGGLGSGTIVNRYDCIPVSNTKVQIIFNDVLDKETAENNQNYIIYDRLGNNLQVYDAKVVSVDEDQEYYDKSVYLITSQQTPGELYTISATNVMNINGEDISSNKSIMFGGIGKKR
ncbi:hypothetical protein [Vallitalea guaymasensis]|uniref:SbsA Ig-like domain-containing protein n=1 Tax=Vallitalea guaymasensis TaxID=1185412 RepID=A0A8J8SC77_9FIRM|nr:hypothetical protein [Vallitalea guaymasensis]QUH29155.1 hypothetical protein HYG85_09550 [Vallitalea guaymasensis]